MAVVLVGIAGFFGVWSGVLVSRAVDGGYDAGQGTFLVAGALIFVPAVAVGLLGAVALGGTAHVWAVVAIIGGSCALALAAIDVALGAPVFGAAGAMAVLAIAAALRAISPVHQERAAA